MIRNEVWRLDIDASWHPDWLQLMDCGFAFYDHTFELAPGLMKIGTIPVLLAQRPVGGTHVRSGCQACGGALTDPEPTYVLTSIPRFNESIRSREIVLTCRACWNCGYTP